MQQRQGICQQQFTETEVVPNPFSGHLRKGKTHQLNFIIYGKEKKKLLFLKSSPYTSGGITLSM